MTPTIRRHLSTNVHIDRGKVSTPFVWTARRQQSPVRMAQMTTASFLKFALSADHAPRVHVSDSLMVHGRLDRRLFAPGAAWISARRERFLAGRSFWPGCPVALAVLMVHKQRTMLSWWIEHSSHGLGLSTSARRAWTDAALRRATYGRQLESSDGRVLDRWLPSHGNRRPS